MSIDPAAVIQPTNDAPLDASLAANLVALVQTMLGVIARCHEAALQSDAESLLVIRGALAHFWRKTEPHACRSAGPNLDRELDGLLDRVLANQEQPLAQSAFSDRPPCDLNDLVGARLPSQECAGALADWFQSLSLTLRQSHPKAVEMLRLRFAGLGSREVATRLDLPFRLVRQVLSDVRSGNVRAPPYRGAAL